MLSGDYSMPPKNDGTDEEKAAAEVRLNLGLLQDVFDTFFFGSYLSKA